jgi:uncharacterized Tic20 family protein
MTETPNPDPHAGDEGPDQPPPQPPYQPPPYQQPQYQPPPYQQPQYQQPAYSYGYPAPGAVTQTDRNWASAAHWGTLVAAWLAMGFLAPLVIMLTIGNESPYVRKHAVESLNFQISLLIYSAAAVLFSILTIGLGLIIVIPLFIAALVAILVFVIQASIRATNGEDYTYPLTLRLVS